MTTIVVDSLFREKLLASGGVAELRDEAGELIGRFFPADQSEEELELALSEAELQERLNGKTFTTAEVLAHLRGLK